MYRIYIFTICIDARERIYMLYTMYRQNLHIHRQNIHIYRIYICTECTYVQNVNIYNMYRHERARSLLPESICIFYIYIV